MALNRIDAALYQLTLRYSRLSPMTTLTC